MLRILGFLSLPIHKVEGGMTLPQTWAALQRPQGATECLPPQLLLRWESLQQPRLDTRKARLEPPGVG